MDNQYTCAVAVVKDGDRYLLGLSTSNDDRRNKWAMPGGHIKRGEDVKKAAARECKEETGITAIPKSQDVFEVPGKKGVAFVVLKPSTSRSSHDLKPNSEFVALGFFTKAEMQSLDLYKTVEPAIKKANK